MTLLWLRPAQRRFLYLRELFCQGDQEPDRFHAKVCFGRELPYTRTAAPGQERTNYDAGYGSLLSKSILAAALRNEASSFVGKRNYA